MDRVSIIIPVYNAGAYLERSLKSICEQSFSNLEIILVDDGSTDDSPGLCDEWALKDYRIRVYHQKNGGVSVARNMGLTLASGEYVMFVDADDWIAPDTVQTLYELLQEHQADVSTCQYIEIFEGQEQLAREQEQKRSRREASD